MNQFSTAAWEAHDTGTAIAGHGISHPIRFAVGLAISAGGAVVLLSDILQRTASFG